LSGSTVLRLRVKAGARRNAILGLHAPPERGKANRAVLELLAEALGLAPSSLELVTGRASPDKGVRIPLSPKETLDRLARRMS
jgi:uncharacterized protein YggU (UPF0235/DUF167 family)